MAAKPKIGGKGDLASPKYKPTKRTKNPPSKKGRKPRKKSGR
jgi:hypothetical protein